MSYGCLPRGYSTDFNENEVDGSRSLPSVSQLTLFNNNNFDASCCVELNVYITPSIHNNFFLH
jgi:hypothetical protein